MKKQTAVDWLYDQLEFDESLSMDDIEKIFNQAKEMEKRQIKDAYTSGWKALTSEQYYNETYSK